MESRARRESHPANGENTATVPLPVLNVLSVWSFVMPILAGLVSSELLKAVKEWWRLASPNAKRRAGFVCAGVVLAVAAFVLVPYSEVLCMGKTPFFGRDLLCHESARSAVAHLSVNLSAYTAQAFSVVAVTVFRLSRRTATQLVVVGGAVAYFTWWVGLYVAAPCALVWATQAAWRRLGASQAAAVSSASRLPPPLSAHGCQA